MRVGLLTTSFPRQSRDYAGSFVLTFARALSAQGCALDVLAPEPGDASYVRPPVFDGISLHWVRYLPRPLERTFYGAGVLDNLARDPLAWLGLAPFTACLARAARRRAAEWDAVVSHWALPCALIAGALRNRPRHLAVLHSADVFLLERLPAAAVIAQRVASGADQLLFVSRDLRKRFLALLPPLARADAATKAHVCAMGIDTARAPEPRARQELRSALGIRGLCVLSLGRLVPIKGIEDAIRAVAPLSDVELCVAGEGPSRESLTRLAEEQGARVRFLGPVHGADKQAWLDAADVFVLPSRVAPSGRTEGVPTALLEAMAAGLPAIATSAGGVPDVVEHDVNGLLVGPAEPHALREALLKLHDPRERQRLGEQARATGERYDLRQLGPVLARLLSENAGSDANRAPV